MTPRVLSCRLKKWRISGNSLVSTRSQYLLLLLKEVKKKCISGPKLARPLATYDAIARNHSNWPSLNLSQNVREGWMNSFWKRQVLMFYPLGRNSEKPYCGRPTSSPGRFSPALEMGARKQALGRGWGVASAPSPSLYVRGLNGFDFYFDLFWMAWHWKPAILILSHNGKLDFKKRTHEK